MKVAFIVTEFPALSETFILNQITGLLDLGQDVEIFAITSFKERKTHNDVCKFGLKGRTHYFFNNKEFSNKIVRVLKGVGLILTNFHRAPVKILRSLNIFKYGIHAASLLLLFATIHFLNRRFDIIHCHFGPNGILAAQLADIGAIEGNIITTFHGYDMTTFLNIYGRDVYSMLFSKGDIFLPISTRWKDKLIALGCDRNRIIVHRMGINTDIFKPLPMREKRTQKVKLLTVSRLVDVKGVKYAIQAAAKLIQLNLPIEYTIAGDGPLKEDLKRTIDELHVVESVKLIGSVDQEEVLRLLQDADIFLATSVTNHDGAQEGIPVSLMEALSMELPVITTRYGCIPELVKDGQFGFLTDERDVDAIADRLAYLINNLQTRMRMGRWGRKFVEENYNIKLLNIDLLNIYNGLVQQKKRQ